MVEDISVIENELKSKYNIDENYYPNISLLRFGGIKKEIINAQNLANQLNINYDLEFYKSFFEEKKEIMSFISDNNELAKKLNEHSKDLTGADIHPILWLATISLGLLYRSILHPYLKSYFEKLGELNAEEKLKKKNQLKNKIEEKIDSELKFEKDKEIVKLTINQYLERKFNE